MTLRELKAKLNRLDDDDFLDTVIVAVQHIDSENHSHIGVVDLDYVMQDEEGAYFILLHSERKHPLPKGE